MGNTHRATIRPSCWATHQRRPCDDTAVTDVLLGKAGTTEPLLLLPFLGQRVSERGASSVGTRVSGSYRRRTLLSHLSAADRSQCPCCFMSRRVLLPIRLDGGLSRGLGYFGAGDIAAQRNRPPQDHPSDRGQTSAHAHAAMRSTVIFGVVGSGGSTVQLPSSCRKKNSVCEPSGPGASTLTYRVPEGVRLNLVTCTNCMEDGASHFSI
jgi:hypothetical protein